MLERRTASYNRADKQIFFEISRRHFGDIIVATWLVAEKHVVQIVKPHPRESTVPHVVWWALARQGAVETASQVHSRRMSSQRQDRCRNRRPQEEIEPV